MTGTHQPSDVASPISAMSRRVMMPSGKHEMIISNEEAAMFAALRADPRAKLVARAALDKSTLGSGLNETVVDVNSWCLAVEDAAKYRFRGGPHYFWLAANRVLIPENDFRRVAELAYHVVSEAERKAAKEAEDAQRIAQLRALAGVSSGIEKGVTSQRPTTSDAEERLNREVRKLKARVRDLEYENGRLQRQCDRLKWAATCETEPDRPKRGRSDPSLHADRQYHGANYE